MEFMSRELEASSVSTCHIYLMLPRLGSCAYNERFLASMDSDWLLF